MVHDWGSSVSSLFECGFHVYKGSNGYRYRMSSLALLFQYEAFKFALPHWLRYPISPLISYAHLLAVVIRSRSIGLPYVPAHFIPLSSTFYGSYVYLLSGFHVLI